MKKLYIYPFCVPQMALIRSTVGKDTSIVPVLANALYHEGMDLGVLDNGRPLPNIEFQSEEELLAHLDPNGIYVFCNADGSKEMLQVGIRISNYLIQQKISFQSYLSAQNIALVQSMDSSCLSSVFHKRKGEPAVRPSSPKAPSYQLHTITKRIIGVGSLLSEGDRKQVCLSLVASLRAQGIRATALMSDAVYQHLDFSHLDYEQSLNEGIDATLLRINHEVSFLAETFDAVVVEIPGQLLRYSEVHLGSAGVWAFLLAQALPIQEWICCLPMQSNGKEYYQFLEEYLRRRFGGARIAFHLSNFLFLPSQKDVLEIPGVFVGEKEYAQKLEKLKGFYPHLYDFKNESSSYLSRNTQGMCES